MTTSDNGTTGHIPSSSGNGGGRHEDDRLDVRGARPTVTRVNRRTVLVVGALGASIGLIVLMLGFGNPNKPRKDVTAEESAVRYSGLIESVKNLPSDYSFDLSQLAQTYAGSNSSVSATTRPAGPSPQELALAQAMRELAEQRRKLLDQQQKEQQAALDSPLQFGGVKSLVSSAVPVTSPPTPTTMPAAIAPGLIAYQTAMTGAGGGDQNLGGAGGTSRNRQSDKETFLTQASSVEPYLTKPLLTPISRYELKAGSVIPGALLTAINTDLPGEVIGQVTENVYDSVTGNHLLVPQGSKLLGKYQSLVINGQNRALIVWQRLLYPNGNSIALDGMPGTDETGQAGLADQVDYHLDKLAQATALTTAIAYAGNLARNPKNTGNAGGSDVIGDAIAQQANRVGEKILDRQLDVQPTITIRQGWPLRVLVNKDMILSPYVP